MAARKKRKRTTTTSKKDLYPNYMTFTVTESAADTFTTSQIFTPIPRGPISGNKATIMEILEVQYYFPNIDMKDDGDQVFASLRMGPEPSNIGHVAEPNVIDVMYLESRLTTSGATLTLLPIIHKLQTHDGYGFLVATDSFYASVNSNNIGTAVTCNFRVYYRFVTVSITEYIGIVQSQQQS